MTSETDPFEMPVDLRRELVRARWTDRAIARQLTSGAWVRPRRGAYVGRAGWEELGDAGRHVVLTRAVLKAGRTALVVSHTSAVVVHGGPAWGLDLKDVHLTRVDGKVGRAEAGVHQHCGALADGDVMQVRGIPVVSPARAALEATTRLPLGPGLAVLNDFLHRGLTTPAAVRKRYDAHMDHWPSSRVTELVVRMGDPRIASVLETLFFVLCFEAGLPAPVPQYPVHDPQTGRLVAELDFAWPELGAFVEADGKVKYGALLKPGESPTDVVVREKEREDLVREITGFRAMRVVWRDVIQPEPTVARLRRLLAEPGV